MTVPAQPDLWCHRDLPIDAALALDAQALEATATDGRRRLLLWTAQPALVVSRRDSRLPGFAAAQQHIAAQYGLPVVVRRSGGTAVMQGPDVLTIGLCHALPAGAPTDMDGDYARLAALCNAALPALPEPIGLSAIDDAYCDGAHNLVSRGRKLAGTAQWRRKKRHAAALVHAAMLVTTDAARMTGIINDFYAAAGAPTAYRPDVCITLAELMPDGADLMTTAMHALMQAGAAWLADQAI